MRLLPILLFVSICFAEIIFTNGTKLAKLQDSLITVIEDGGNINKHIIRDMKRNWWVRTADCTAPGNLVIRQYCIIDLAEGRDHHKIRIKRMMDKLSKYDNSSYRLWAEGYSYWLYTNRALQLWLQAFPNKEVYYIAYSIDSGFAHCSYRIDSLYYPAPFGDLRNVPLDSVGQDLAKYISDKTYAKCQNVIRTANHYTILAWPVGMNNHCPKLDKSYEIGECGITNFTYYEGYDKKYDSEEAEWYDIINPIRLISTLFLW